MNTNEVLKLALDALYETVHWRATGLGRPPEQTAMDAITGLLRVLEQPAIPQDWKLLPLEPTDTMVQAAHHLDLSYMPGQEGADRAAIYRAMVKTAPGSAHEVCQNSEIAPDRKQPAQQEPVAWGWAIMHSDGTYAWIRPRIADFFGSIQEREPYTSEDAKHADREWAGLAPHTIVTLYTSPPAQPDFWEGYVPEPVGVVGSSIKSESPLGCNGPTGPAQQEQGDSICQENDGCPTEKAVLQRFWRGQSIPDEHYPAWFKPAQQEPVAWMHEWEDGERIPMLMGRDDRNNDQPKSVRPLVFGDTSPPAQRKPLTDERIESVRHMRDVQGYDGNWNYDPYMQGLYNGLEFALSLLEVREPQFKDAPETWLGDIKVKYKLSNETEAKLKEKNT